MMTCPSEQQVIAAALGELLPREATRVGQHIATCGTCGALMREHCELQALLLTNHNRTSTEAGFIRNVMDRCVQARTGSVSFYRRPWFYASVSIAAAAALWLSRPSLQTDFGVVAARGTSSRGVAPVTPDVLLLRGNTLLPIEGAELHASDGITVRYWNPSDEPAFLAVFALDTAAAVHWIYPAYLRAADNPQSIRLQHSIEGKIMGEAVEPESPAPGRLRVVALLTPEPLSVHDVEARLAHDGQRLINTFPEARVHEWNCTWVER